MDELVNIDQVSLNLSQHHLIAYYFTSDNCGVCHDVKKTLIGLFELYPQIRVCEINVAKVPMITSKFEVFSAPTLILFYRQKEIQRFSRFFVRKEVEKGLERLLEIDSSYAL